MLVLKGLVALAAFTAVASIALVIIGVALATIRRMGERHEETEQDIDRQHRDLREKNARGCRRQCCEPHKLPTEPADNPDGMWQEDFGGESG